MSGQAEQLANGVAVFRVTDEPARKSNIYCEFPWCSSDSRWFIYTRAAPEHAPNSQEYVACAFGSWEQRVIGHGTGGCTMACGRLYFRRQGAKGRPELVRVDLTADTVDVLDIPAAVVGGGVRISADERYLAYSYAVSYRPQRFAIGLADLRTGTCEVLHEDPYICNPHLQFERGAGRQLLVQHNRGCSFSSEGKCEVLCGKEGCTLFLLSVPGGEVTRLRVGPPYTASCSGHETWLGDTQEIILTLNLQEDYDYGKGPIMGVRPGSDARSICPPAEMNHIGTPPSGKVFCADTYRPDAIIIGSPVTNRMATVCPAKTSYRRTPEDTHPHAYISPDLKWVVFNSDRDGAKQIYAASIPPAMIVELTRTSDGAKDRPNPWGTPASLDHSRGG